MELRIDPRRRGFSCRAGMPVRALDGERVVTVDIAELDKESLLTWLRSRGGANRWAENVVGILLGQGQLHHVAFSPKVTDRESKEPET